MSKPTVAILGASADRAKFGNKSVRAHVQQGFEVFPVNPKGGAVEGLTVYKSLAEIPGGKLNRVSVYLPPPLVLKALDDIATRGCDELFLNPGTENPEVVGRAEALGLNPILACSIVDLGVRPKDFSDE